MSRVLKMFFDPRLQLFIFALIAVGIQLILWLVSPEQSLVVLYKLGLPLLAAILGLFFDAAVFPYARPYSYLKEYWFDNPEAQKLDNADYPIVKGYIPAFTMACLRRAIIVAAFVIAVSLGL